MATFKQYSQTLNDASEAFSIESFASDEINVRVDGVLKSAGTHYNITNYTTNGGTVTWTTGNVPAENAVVRIYRLTSLTAPQATFQAGSSVKAGDLNNNQIQILRALQEAGHQTDVLVQNWDYEPDSVTTAEIKDDTIVNANVSPTAEIAVSKLAQAGVNRQLLQTSGNDVEWTSNIQVPGTFTSVGAGQFNSTVSIAGALTVNSTVDGRDIAADGAKLDGVEAGAKGDQSNAEIRAAVEAATDSNVFTDADHSKLNAIEANATADQTNAEIRAAVEAASDSNVFTDADHTKLNGIAEGAEVNVQSDWNSSSGDNQILNKPTLVSGINDLSDVDTTGVANDKILKYVAADSKWKIADDASGAGGQANQNAFSNVAVSGQTTVAADTATDTLTIVGGTNVTVTTDASADSVTIAASGGEVTVQDEGSSLSTAATTLNFVGAGVTASGTGATKTITISGGGGAVTTDFQYLELKAHNNASGAFSAGSADYELVTKGTTTAVDPGQAAALMISIGGVLQEPNTGTSIGSNDGFCVDGSSIHFGANLTAHPEYILWLKGSGSHTIADDSIAEVKLDISNTASDGQFLQYKDSTDKLTWASVTGTPEGTAVKSTGESGTTKFLRVDGDGTCSWQVPPDNDTVYTHPNHSGEVTSTADGATVITDNVVDEANLKVSNAPTNGHVLTAQSGNTGGLTWAAASSGTITALNNQTADRLTTIGATTTELDGEANLTFNDAATTGLISGRQVTGRGFECPATVSDDWTIAAGNNAMFPGPMTVAANKTVTVPANRTLTIV